MIRLLIILMLSGCATDINRSQSIAVHSLKSFDISEVDLSPVIITVDSRDYIPGRRAGWYNPQTKEIYLLKNCPDYVAIHEFKHQILDSVGIPCCLHHGIINP